MAEAEKISTAKRSAEGFIAYRTVDGDCPDGHVVLIGLDGEVGNRVGHELSELLRGSALSSCKVIVRCQS